MKKIEKLEKQIHEEYGDAEKYITCALLNKDEDISLSELYYQLATEELKHADRLHDMVVRIIDEHKREKGEPPKEMTVIYNILHERDIEYATKVKMMIQQYKG